MTVGVAISTHARPAILQRALNGWAAVLPDLLVVTHDVAGDGVAVTKNRGLAALMDAGCEHLFLVDDDVWPISDRWLEYVETPALHLMHCWGQSRFVEHDNGYSVWSWPRGVALYVHRSVVERVGGMRTEFGRWGGEHVEWSRRIHAAGLTPHPFMDLAAARSGIWHCEDYTRRTPSTVGEQERRASAGRRKMLYRRYDGSAEHVPYRGQAKS